MCAAFVLLRIVHVPSTTHKYVDCWRAHSLRCSENKLKHKINSPNTKCAKSIAHKTVRWCGVAHANVPLRSWQPQLYCFNTYYIKFCVCSIHLPLAMPFTQPPFELCVCVCVRRARIHAGDDAVWRCREANGWTNATLQLYNWFWNLILWWLLCLPDCVYLHIYVCGSQFSSDVFGMHKTTRWRGLWMWCERERERERSRQRSGMNYSDLWKLQMGIYDLWWHWIKSGQNSIWDIRWWI